MTTPRWYGGQAEVPILRSFSSRKLIRLVSFSRALVSWNRKLLLQSRHPGHKEEFVFVARDRFDLDPRPADCCRCSSR